MAPDQPGSKRAADTANASASLLPADVMNRESLLGLFDHDEALLAELAQLFLEDCPQLMQDIRTGVGECDAKKVEHAAHTLKGSVGNFGAKGGFELARRLESMGRSQDLAGAPQVLGELEQEISKVTSVLAAIAGKKPE
jgi:HPt (histidine-containing phosphotransfer) domain-containing protein